MKLRVAVVAAALALVGAPALNAAADAPSCTIDGGPKVPRACYDLDDPSLTVDLGDTFARSEQVACDAAPAGPVHDQLYRDRAIGRICY